MDILLKDAKIIYPGASLNGKVQDILIKRGKIEQIGKNLKPEGKTQVITGKALTVSPGWVDMFSFLADPGLEQKEDIGTGIKAAAAGGFTATCCMPNTQPPLDSKSGIEYVINKAMGKAVDVYPIGALSEKCQGSDITEMYDMHQAGAIAFSDGVNSAISSGLTLRSLQYVKPFDGVIITHPNDKSISRNGQIHEGEMSTVLGMTGIPSLSEELTVQRDIELLQYTESRLHFAFVSTAGAVERIKKAKAAGLNVTCSVSPYNLGLTDAELESYDSNYKVMPPLRSKADCNALIKGLKDGTIDTIASCHIPHDTECKNLEFDLADFGMIGFETAYALANTLVGKKLDQETLVQKLAIAPRGILGLELPDFEVGSKANITIFDAEETWTFTKQDIKSRSKNTPFVGREFTGKIKGIVNNGIAMINE